MKKKLKPGKFIKRNLDAIVIYALVMIAVILVSPLELKDRLSLQLGGITLFTTIFIGYLNYQHAQDRLFKDLFKEFNERYEHFNNSYQRIKEAYDIHVEFADVNNADKKLVIDYLNLCAEEYYWFEKGRIEESAWESWKSGMETWATLPIVKVVFRDEVATWKTSYYLGFQDFFKSLIL